VLSFDKDFNESYAKVKSTYTVIHNKKIKIITDRGREIICTPEHLILTNNGFKKAEDLNKKDLVSTYLFTSYPNTCKDDRIFLTEEKIRKTAKSFGLNKDRYIDELKEKGLINLKYNNKNTHILASLLGFLLTDGSLSLQKNNLRSAEFFVNKIDIDEIVKDLNLIGYNPGIRNQEIKGKINNREFIQKISRVRVSKTSFFILMASLGGIVGKKFEKGLKVPEWILNGPKEIQKSFLQGFLGGDGPKLVVRTIERENGFYNKPLINPIEFHFNDKAENTPKKFTVELGKLLENQGISIRKISINEEKRYERKDKKTSILLKISLKTDIKSAYNYSLIGFKYCYNKKYSSSLAREYLKDRLESINQREKLKSKVLEMKDKISINELSRKLKLSYSVIKNWIEGKLPSPPHNPIRYSDWLRKYSNGKILYDPIKSINKKEGNQYPFISISLDNDTKMFVANDIIHHNCMPCLMLSPVIEELAEEMKEVKFVKINVDDNKELAGKYQVSSIPCLILFKEGKEVDRLIGNQSQEDIEEKINEHLG
jgi:thioredoxin 1